MGVKSGRSGTVEVDERQAKRAKWTARAKAAMYTISLRKVGGSLMAAVPAEVVKDLRLKPGQTLSVAIDGGRIVLERVKERAPERYTLRQILKSCNFDLPKTQEELDWQASPGMGDELL